MKKRSLTAIAAIFCLMLCFLFSGCASDELGLEAAQKDPQAYLLRAVEHTAEELGTDEESTISKLMKALSEKGTVTVRLEDVDDVDISAVVAYDQSAQAVSGTVAVSADGVRLDMKMWGNADAFAVAVPEILGETAYGLSWETLTEDLSKSEIWNMIGISYGDIAEQIEPMLEQIKQAMDKQKSESPRDELSEKIEAILREAEYTVAEDGEDAVCVGFTVTKEQMRGFVDTLLDGEPGQLLEMIGDSDDGENITEQVREALLAICADAKIEARIDNETGLITAVNAELAYTDDTEGECRLRLHADLADRKDITLTVGAQVGNEAEETATLRLRNQDTQDSITRLLTLNTEDKEISVLLTYKNEMLVLTCSSEHAVVFDLDAHLTLSERALALSDIRIQTDSLFGGTQTLPVRIDISTEAQVAQMPAYTNLLTMPKTQLSTLLQALADYFA